MTISNFAQALATFAFKYWTVIEVELMNWRCEHHSSNRNLSSCEFQPEKKFQGFNGFRTHRLYVSSEVLYQLNYEGPYVGSRQIYGVHLYQSHSCHKSEEEMLFPFLIANTVTKRKKIYHVTHAEKDKSAIIRFGLTQNEITFHIRKQKSRYTVELKNPTKAKTRVVLSMTVGNFKLKESH